ncbi:MAG TPA: hypothetical protein VK081_05570 [Planctomycetota bacterium]|nr:hypothetical protein [Planctomycetota bacterium]
MATSSTRPRVPGWIVVLLMLLFIAGLGVAIWFAVRPDPTLPVAPIERR